MPLLHARVYKSIRARARETRARARLYLLTRTRIHFMAGGVKHPPTTPRGGAGGLYLFKNINKYMTGDTFGGRFPPYPFQLAHLAQITTTLTT